MAFFLAELGTRYGTQAFSHADAARRMLSSITPRCPLCFPARKHTLDVHVPGTGVSCHAPFHVVSGGQQSLCVAMPCSGNLDGQQRLIVKGRFLPKGFENVIRRYVNECDPFPPAWLAMLLPVQLMMVNMCVTHISMCLQHLG